jgi:hypothetical protein
LVVITNPYKGIDYNKINVYVIHDHYVSDENDVDYYESDGFAEDAEIEFREMSSLFIFLPEYRSQNESE